MANEVNLAKLARGSPGNLATVNLGICQIVFTVDKLIFTISCLQKRVGRAKVQNIRD